MPDRQQQTSYRVEALDRKHNRKAFSSGVEPLDRYLREQAGQDARKRVAAPFVLCEGNGNAVLGYDTLSALSINVGAWPADVAGKLPRYPVLPATLLGRLAVDQSRRGKGLGEHLLMDALRRALAASREVASVTLVVDAKDDAAVAFYRRHEFIRFADMPHRLFLPMGTIERLFAWHCLTPPRARASTTRLRGRHVQHAAPLVDRTLQLPPGGDRAIAC